VLLLMITAALALMLGSPSTHADAQAPTKPAPSNSPAKKAPAFVWWEGESTETTNFPAESWLSAKNFPDTAHHLSGGQWLSVAWKPANDKDTRNATYAVTVPEAGEYQLWARKFWRHGPFSWRIGGGEWTFCGPDAGLEDSVDLMKFVSTSWVHAGRAKLAKGATTFEVRVEARPGQDISAAFDCFLLTMGAFQPRGKMKPGEKSGQANPGYWAFEPDLDDFGESAINLRHLNEKVAGEKGHVKRKGDGFVLGNNTPVRFWGVNVGGGMLDFSDASLEYMAKKLARLGVNLVRLHGAVYDESSSDPAKVDERKLGRIHKLVALLKAEGIYTTLSFYFPLWMNMRDAYGDHGYRNQRNKTPFSLLFFDPWMQNVHRTWLEALLTAKNPHTGLPLGKDPAVATVELLNEDSFFFWTFSHENIPAPKLEILEKRFGTWLADKHGSIDKAISSWGWQPQARDDAKAKRMTLLPAWDMTAQGATNGPKRKRMSDQMRFLAETQTEFYQSTIEHCQKKHKTKCLFTCSNWHTADARIMEAIEWNTYMVGDAIDRHAYFGGKHEGENAGWNVAVGHTFQDRSCMKDPAASPFAASTVKDMPMMVSELGWPNPNRFRAELPFLCATYGAMQGIDAFHLFAVNSAAWETGVAKFQVATPITMGQFPAMALAYRRGDVAEADPVIVEAISMREQFDYKGTATSGTPNLDAFRAVDIPEGGQRKGELRGIDPLAFFAGRVVKKYGGDSNDSVANDLKRHISDDRKFVSTKDRDLEWNTDTGVVTVDTKRFQGTCGFVRGMQPHDRPAGRDLKVMRHNTSNLTIECAAEYASIVAISLDDAPIETTKCLLIQVATEEQPLGWKTEDAGGGNTKITSLGGYPIGMASTSAYGRDTMITIKRKLLFTKATAVDINGAAISTVVLSPGTADGKDPTGAQTIVWPAGTMHVVLE